MLFLVSQQRKRWCKHPSQTGVRTERQSVHLSISHTDLSLAPPASHPSPSPPPPSPPSSAMIPARLRLFRKRLKELYKELSSLEVEESSLRKL